MHTKPGSAGLPFFGVNAAVVTEDGDEVEGMHSGTLVIKDPWPSMLRTLYKGVGDRVRAFEDVVNVPIYGEVERSPRLGRGSTLSLDFLCDRDIEASIVDRIRRNVGCVRDCD